MDLRIVLVDDLQKNKGRIQTFKETGDSRYIYQNELDKACFQHDMLYGGFKDLTRRTASDKILRVKHLILLKIQNMIDINADLLTFDKKILVVVLKNKNISKKNLAEGLHKSIIRKFSKRKVKSPFSDNIWGTDLADMQLISIFCKEFRFLL